MSFLSSLVILCLALTIHALDDSCETHIYTLKTCSAIITFSGNCQSMTVNLSHTEYAQCTSNGFFWSYPLNNLTLVIETLFTEKHQAYKISLNNEQLFGAITNVYRIIDNKEIEITTHEKTLIQQSDSNYQVILKFQGPTRLGRYGVNINYESV